MLISILVWYFALYLYLSFQIFLPFLLRRKRPSRKDQEGAAPWTGENARRNDTRDEPKRKRTKARRVKHSIIFCTAHYFVTVSNYYSTIRRWLSYNNARTEITLPQYNYSNIACLCVQTQGVYACAEHKVNNDSNLDNVQCSNK